ncbi:hypothetical protein NQ038_04160 [Brevibacterium sp. 50QC2O2]|uniref:hypothetical protein n=1 Tax=Brevibacterium sp. 50QC2O2 TaxID=2968459 RepID=UPI00211B9E78|nr:hypothetical protein [Brevibacterium sp. 50QC2O2]MCQ9387837.1 hypothetical protein [Brevibacterium sp. 50QC2O2]
MADILRDKDEMHGFVAADAFVGGVVDMQDVRLNAYPDRFRFWRPPFDAGRGMERGIQAADAQTMEALSRRRQILGAVLDELEKLNSRKGMRRARRLTSWTTGLSESPLESLTLLALKHLGITDVYQQVVFMSRDGRFQDRVDFFIPHLNLIIEADGWSKYSGPDDIKREKRREERLRAHHNLIRVEWRDVIPGPSGYGMVRKALEVGIHLG